MRVLQEQSMSTDIQIESMSVAEKVQLLETVWQSLCAHPGDVRSPEWHREVLEERARRLDDGRATISNWADAKARLLQLGR
jgi:putative addiction module component (TIGR02574 family)